ncbi:hypothetical protein O3P69_017186 [Scylla paramamosain]|uniref:Ig-like domain-containing protein n=1 Tax=Scylla paramamosain TaxID=85552 RepID=A0AAW0TXQ7_SCYPA
MVIILAASSSSRIRINSVGLSVSVSVGLSVSVSIGLSVSVSVGLSVSVIVGLSVSISATPITSSHITTASPTTYRNVPQHPSHSTVPSQHPKTSQPRHSVPQRPSHSAVQPTMVAWIHLNRKMIVSIHNHVITRQPRFTVTHDSHKTWTLHVRQVTQEDRGQYMCQVNSAPMISQQGYLQVVGE